MTRPSKQARVHQQWREQAARLVAEALGKSACEWCQGRRVDGGHNCPACGGRFDVATVRAYAERLLAEGERLELERQVFADWTREQGKGPENRERGAFVHPETDADWVTREEWERGDIPPDLSQEHIEFLWSAFGRSMANPAPHDAAGVAKRGGWPGPLAREWGTVECEACDGKGRVFGPWICGDDGPDSLLLGCTDTWHHPHCLACTVRRPCEPCRGRGRLPHPSPKRHRSAPNGGAWMVRAARRLLDTLDGRCPWAPSAGVQPSECRGCDGLGVNETDYECTDEGRLVRPDCDDCHGTGHNLAGALPEIEDSEAAISRAFDAYAASLRRVNPRGSMTDRQREVLLRAQAAERWPEGDPGPVFRTVLSNGRTLSRCGHRVVPRGEHRNVGEYYVRPRDLIVDFAPEDRPPLDECINGRCWDSRAAVRGGDLSRWPRWHRGEILHAEQRRERAQVGGNDSASEVITAPGPGVTQ